MNIVHGLNRVLVISGGVAAGKTTLAKNLHARGWDHVKTRAILAAEARRRGWPVSVAPDRKELQEIGARLDAHTNGGEWIADFVGYDCSVVDAVRRPEQVDAIRRGARWAKVYHVHLTAPRAVLASRFNSREVETFLYETVKADAIESKVDEMEATADMVIDTSECTEQDTVLRVLAACGALFNTPDRDVDVLVGAQFGSEGKGHIVSHIAPEYRALVRVGGPNAGHTVLHPKTGEKVSFYHLPSGSLHAPLAKLVLGPGACINVDILAKEAEHLGGLEALTDRLYIDPQANIVTSEDIEREAAVVKAIGSTGQGVGEATAGKILGRGAGRKLARDIPALAPFICDAQEIYDASSSQDAKILLEGTQGTLLSLHHGYYPYVTSRDTTAGGTAAEAGLAPGRINEIFMVTRTNPIRVQSPEGGTSGPMGIELSWEEVGALAGIPADVLREKERTTTTKRLRRIAKFNWSDFHKACKLNSPTAIALTFADYIDENNQHARRFEQLSSSTHRFIEELERFAACPVSLITTRFHQRSIIDRRS